MIGYVLGPFVVHACARSLDGDIVVERKMRMPE